MTAVLPNELNGPNGFQVDGFVYPQFLGIPLRAPTTQDIYNPGTRWQDNSVNPPVQYYTVGAGLWYQTANTAFGVSSVTGTANQITASPTTGNVILSIPAAFIAPGSIASTTTITSGTSMSATTTFTAGTGITSTTGNLALNGVGSKVVINAAAPATASVGTSAAMTAGAITVASTAVTAASIIFVSANTLAGTPGTLSAPAASRVAGVSFGIVSSSNTDTSTVNYWIVN